jgi:hypothetical protein
MVSGSNGGLLRVLKHRDFRFLLGGYAISSTGEWLYSVALAVYIFEQTRSVSWVAASLMSRLIPLLLLSPFGGVIADRYNKRIVMIVSDLSRGALMFALALAATMGSLLPAILLAAVSGLGATVYAPALSAITPALVGEEDLAPANASMSTIESVALVAGPAIGAVLLLLGSPAVAFAVNGATFLISASAVAAIRRRRELEGSTAQSSLRRRVAEGFSAVSTSADVRVLLGAIVIATVTYGQENVLFVLVSEQRLGTGSEGVGFLFAAVGMGGVLAAGLSSRLAQGHLPGLALGLGLVLSGTAVASLSVVSMPLIAYLVVGVDGIGTVVLDVIAITMLQRTVARGTLARVHGILMSAAFAGTLVGSLIAPISLRLVGLPGALLIAGGLPIGFLLLTGARLRALSRRAAARGAQLDQLVQTLAGLSLFQGARRQALEELARTAEKRRTVPGRDVVREGDVADSLYIVLKGSLAVLSSRLGQPEMKLATLGPGDHFGEIGLIRKVPRTATVRAVIESELLRIPGEDFLTVMNQVPAMSATLLDVIARRLARTGPVSGQEGNAPR